jgi:serine phosphatase RsbU (regulator of sigma subunit)
VTQDEEFEPTLLVSPKQAGQGPVAADVLGHYLVVLEGAEPGRRLEVSEVPVTIGRDPQQTLSLADAELSRRHARISLVNDEAVVEDLRSTNGTFVDGKRITGAWTLKQGHLLRVGSQTLRYERRSKRDVERAEELDRDLLRASNYVLSLLPARLTAGPVLAQWRFVPSAQLGGDAFGYYWLDPERFVFYLIDVSGHGAGSAMHSVTVLNVLRQQALPQVDFADPASVLASLNARFQMDGHNGLFFTMWYGVYSTRDRTLVCGSAGHHPAYLVPPDRSGTRPLGTSALMIGVALDIVFPVERTTVPHGTSLYLFSDGAFEIVTSDERRWALSDFLPLLHEPVVPDTPEADRIYQSVRQAAAPGQLEDDFSLMVVTFP